MLKIIHHPILFLARSLYNIQKIIYIMIKQMNIQAKAPLLNYLTMDGLKEAPLFLGRWKWSIETQKKRS